MRQLFCFALIGCAAALVHLSVAVAAAEWLQLPLQAANLAGWTAAVMTSYLGQSRYTFAVRTRTIRHLPRFVAVAFLSWSITATVAAMTRHAGASLTASFATGIALAAFCTYVLGRNWVFAYERNT
ncbi:MAG: GtrA family protein [Steroidobacteraceae bacterium]